MGSELGHKEKRRRHSKKRHSALQKTKRKEEEQPDGGETSGTAKSAEVPMVDWDELLSAPTTTEEMPIRQPDTSNSEDRSKQLQQIEKPVMDRLILVGADITEGTLVAAKVLAGVIFGVATTSIGFLAIVVPSVAQLLSAIAGMPTSVITFVRETLVFASDFVPAVVFVRVGMQFFDQCHQSWSMVYWHLSWVSYQINWVLMLCMQLGGTEMVASTLQTTFVILRMPLIVIESIRQALATFAAIVNVPCTVAGSLMATFTRIAEICAAFGGRRT